MLYRKPAIAQILAACMLLASTVPGCGRNAHELASVSGRVTLHGKPLADINVTFQPVAKAGSGGDAGLGSSGVTGADGRFQIKTFDGKPGAVVGKHRVLLSVRNPQASTSDAWSVAVAPSPLPTTASDGSMAFDVPANGTNQANFDF